jgi:hypothetical protein
MCLKAALIPMPQECPKCLTGKPDNGLGVTMFSRTKGTLGT